MHLYQSEIVVPEILIEMLEIPENSNPNFCLYYSTKPTYYDGITLFTVSYFDIYQPFAKHPVILHELAKASRFFDGARIDLGSDDTEPTHVLLIPEDRKLQIAEYNKAMSFLRQQRPTETINLSYEEMQNLASELEPTDLGNFRKQGMFEFFSQPSIEATTNRQLLIEELNKFIPYNLIQDYASILGISETQAFFYLSGGAI